MEPESLHRFTVNDVAIDDLIDIFFINIGVPDPLGIHHADGS
jgi:hypothetical protein